MPTVPHTPASRLLLRAALISVGALAVLGYGVPVVAQARPDTDPLRRFSASVEALVKKVSPSIVQISAAGYGAVGESDRANAGLTIGPQHAIGSGFIIDSAGYIITNAHVIRNAQQVQVNLSAVQSDGTPPGSSASQVDALPATVVGIAPDLDLAVIRIEGPTKWPALSLANYTDLHQGQVVFAFGSPGGLPNSVTMGILSSTARQPNPDSPLTYLQTDAPINPGSSGGPLVNVNGEVIGVNTFILSQSGGNEGLGFAIPSGVIKIAFQQIRQFGHMHRGEIGLDVQTISPGLATALGLARSNGIIVADVLPGGSAEAAGVQIGDVVTAIDGMPVGSVPAFRSRLITHGGGETVHLDVLRGTAPLAFDVRVMQRPHDIDQMASLADPAKSLVPALGIIGIAIDPKIAGALPGLRAPYGVLVAARAAGSTADVPLVSGDVIRTLDGVQVRTVEALRSALEGVPRGVPIVLQIQRDDHLMFVSFTLDGP